jgi:hypothetical protein
MGYTTFISLIVGASFLGSGTQATTDEGSVVPLRSLRPVSTVKNMYFSDAFSIAGIAYKNRLQAHRDVDGARMTFAIPPGMTNLVFEAGVNDIDPQRDPQRTASYQILLDGSQVPGNGTATLAINQVASHVVIRVEGKKSLCIVLSYGACLAEPRLVGPKKGGKPEGPYPPELWSPADRAQVSGDAVMLRWKPVEGAISYAVSIISYKCVDPATGDTPRVWCATVKGTSYSFKLSDVPKGEYLWSVVAFGPTKSLGGYSDERVIVVDRE